MKSLGRITILDIRLLFLAVFVPIFWDKKHLRKRALSFGKPVLSLSQDLLWDTKKMDTIKLGIPWEDRITSRKIRSLYKHVRCIFSISK